MPGSLVEVYWLQLRTTPILRLTETALYIALFCLMQRSKSQLLHSLIAQSNKLSD